MSTSAPPLSTPVEVAVGFSFADEPIDSVVVSLVHGKRRHDVVLRGDHPRALVELAHDPREPLSLTYQYVVHFMQTPTGHVDPMTSVERKTDSSVIIVPARELYQLLRVQVTAASRFETIRQIAVEVRPRACPQNVATAQLADERREWGHRWVIDRDAPRDYDYRVTVDAGNGEIRRGPWLQSDNTLLLVSEYPGEPRTVEARLVGKDPQEAGIAGVTVRFSYIDKNATVPPQQAEFEISNVKPIRWTYWSSSTVPEAFRYQFTLVHADGTTKALEPVTSKDLVILHAIT